MAKIFIMGSGVVGTATGRGFSDAGHNVTFVDILPTRLEYLTAEGFTASAELVLDSEPSFIFLTLPTPHVGRHYDLSIFEAGVAGVGRALKASTGSHTVVCRSTVPPGTAEGLVRSILETESGKTAHSDFALASNPEFLRAASAADDFRFPWMTVIASRSKRTQERLRDLLAPFGGEMRLYDDPATAEFIKCSHNVFNAAKISFWNEMWLVAEHIGVDLDEVSATVALSAEGSINPAYGIRGGAPYGGVCLPKDTNGFLGFAADLGIDMPMLSSVIEVNELLESAAAGALDDSVSAGTVIDLDDDRRVSA